jgi:four helix bundle protein
MAIQSIKDIQAFNKAFEFAMEILHISSKFPSEERYSLTDQIRRSSRSISVNIAEGWAKRVYPQQFKKHLMDSYGSTEETKVWLEFAHRCGYLDHESFERLSNLANLISSMIYNLHTNWK